jgi:hypothetical protein
LGRGSSKRKERRQQKPVYKCRNPPCIHIVRDERKGFYKVFLEDYDGLIIPIPYEELKRVCRRLEEVEVAGLREASGDEVDYLARKYLDAEPQVEEAEE